ncbi:hypothetical protein N2152v2_008616 [Parachlorella kessleri]
MTVSGPMATLVFPERTAPLAVLAASKLADVPFEIKPDAKLGKDAAPTLYFQGGEEVAGVPNALRFIARAARSGEQLYGADALSASQVDQWLDFACTALVSGSGFEAACKAVNDFLSMRTLLVGYAVSMADVACWGQLQGTLQWDKLKKSGNFPHLARWYDFLGEVSALREAAEQYGVKRRSAAPAGGAAGGKGQQVQQGQQEGSTDHMKGGGDTGSFDVGLKDVEVGKVVTRFPPEPSGYLHIGHAKAALLNQHIASMYKGRMLVRFDDTNPSKEKDEYVDNIIADMQKLGLQYEKITCTSDYFPQLEECAIRLIKAGHLYADDTPVEKMREERMEGIESACRNRSVEENLRIFQEMHAGTEEGLRNCMRIKLDMTAANKALRDPVCYRCNPTHHWRTGNKYKCYPTYDFACPFVDAYEGVTHAMRTSEYKDREAQFYWILRLQQSVWPELPHVQIWDYARLSFVHTVLSKRKLTWFVNKGIVEGWDDPRMPTVQGMMRRGLQLEALKEFILSQGASKNVTYQEWDKIWTINKKVIDPVCPRHTAVEVTGKVPVRLTNGPAEPEFVTIPRHKKYPPAGKKAQLRTSEIWLDQADAAAVSEGEEVTLMDWGNAIIRSIQRDAASGAVTAIGAELHLAGDFKKTKLKLTWLAGSEELVPLELQQFGYLITKRKMEEEDAFEDFVNYDSKTVIEAVGDANMRTLQKGDVIQLERKGYYIVDQPLLRPYKPMVLFNIPDGRQQKS